MILPADERLVPLVSQLLARDWGAAAAAARALLQSPSDERTAERAAAQFCLAEALTQLNDSQRADEAWALAADQFSAAGNREWALLADANRARLKERTGDLDGCEHLALRVIEDARNSDLPLPWHYTELILAYCNQRRRNYLAAEPLFESAAGFFFKGNNTYLLLRCWEGLAWVFNATGRRDAGRQLERQILERQRQQHDPLALATTLLAAGFGAWIDGDLDRMRAMLEEALQILSAHKNERLLMSVHNNLAMASVELDDWGAVRRHASLALLHAGRSGDNRRPPLAYGLQMHLALYESRPLDAAQLADEAVFAMREFTSPEALQFLRWRPVAHLAAGDLPRSQRMWNEAPPPCMELEQVIHMRWMRRTLRFLQSSGYKPDAGWSAECREAARSWELEVATWIESADKTGLAERWQQA